MKLKNKLSLGIGFLFLVIVIFGLLGILSINLMKNNAKNVLKNNYETLLYCNNMLKALDMIPEDTAAFNALENNLRKQELNISEPGEQALTEMLRSDFELLKSQSANDSIRLTLSKNIKAVTDLNMEAILRKNQAAEADAETATTWLTVIFTVLVLISFTMAVNFPSVISSPVKALAEGISAIARKDYKKRIHLEQKDEFGELANAFNSMAEKLDEYEHSNLDKLIIEKKRIETIINQMKDGIIGFDSKKNILFINAVAQNLLGLKEEDVIGKYAADVAIRNDLLRKLLRDEENGKELKIYADNKQSYFNRDILDVTNNGEIIGQVIVLRNVTPFYELNEAKTNFIATVSHELKTPISSIKMSAKLLADDRVGVVNNEQKELIKSIQDDSERLLNITSELLNMSQAETGNINLNIQPADPKKIIDYATDAVKIQMEQKQIRLKIATSDLPLVEADEEKTSWVLTNFLSNATRYSYNNSEIIIMTERADGHLKFIVQDFGVGIAPEYKDKIFNRYFRVPGTKKDGTGLGLAICKDFIEAQEGNISVDSEIGVGSTFTFTLKLAALSPSGLDKKL